MFFLIVILSISHFLYFSHLFVSPTSFFFGWVCLPVCLSVCLTPLSLTIFFFSFSSLQSTSFLSSLYLIVSTLFFSLLTFVFLKKVIKLPIIISSNKPKQFFFFVNIIVVVKDSCTNFTRRRRSLSGAPEWLFTVVGLSPSEGIPAEKLCFTEHTFHSLSYAPSISA